MPCSKYPVLSVRMDPQLHRQISLQSKSEDKTISEWICDAVKQKLAHSDPSRISFQKYSDKPLNRSREPWR